jgi:TPR repeat protein
MTPRKVINAKSKGEKIDLDKLEPDTGTGGKSGKTIARNIEVAKAQAAAKPLLWQHATFGSAFQKSDVRNYDRDLSGPIDHKKDQKEQKEPKARRVQIDCDPQLNDNPPMFWPDSLDDEVRTLHTRALEGDPFAQLSMGMMFTDERSEETLHDLHPTKNKKETDLIGASWIQKAALQGDAPAQALLGEFYYQGRGVLKNYEKAFYWFMNAAKQNNPGGQLKVGRCYENGEGIIQSKLQATEWYEKAALQEHEPAQIALGIMFCKGEQFTEKLDEKSIKEYTKMGFDELVRVAEQDKNANAQYWLGIIFKNGKEVKRDYKLAFEWIQKAALQGDARAETELGVIYKRGRGVAKDFVQAFEWSKKAADKGELEAQCNLAELYLEGKGVEPSEKSAFKWFQKAATQGSARAQFGISMMYKESNAVAQSDFQAFEWCRRAADKEYPQAQLALALMYAEGKGIERDFFTAILCVGKVSIPMQRADFGEWNPTIETKRTLDKIQELDKASRSGCIFVV